MKMIGRLSSRLRTTFPSTKGHDPHALDDLLHSVACKSAVRANDKNTVPELWEIVQLLQEDENARYCPHGVRSPEAFPAGSWKSCLAGWDKQKQEGMLRWKTGYRWQ